MNERPVYKLNSHEQWQELLDRTQSLLGLPTALVDTENIILQSSGQRNELCNKIRSQEKALPVICGQSQQFMAKMALSQKSFVVETCEAGMAKLVVPVFQNENYLGCVTACGCMLPETEIESYLLQKTAGMDEQSVSEMAKTTPVLQMEQLEEHAEDLFDRINGS